MKRTPSDIPFTVEKRGDATVYKLQPGALVFCDDCGEDWTERTETGGFLVQSKAICPECAIGYREQLKHFNETHLIRAECPAGKPFAVWVREDLRRAA